MLSSAPPGHPEPYRQSCSCLARWPHTGSAPLMFIAEWGEMLIEKELQEMTVGTGERRENNEHQIKTANEKLIYNHQTAKDEKDS